MSMNVSHFVPRQIAFALILGDNFYCSTKLFAASRVLSPFFFQFNILISKTYRWHSSLAFEPPSNPIINSLGLPPARVYTFESIALVAIKALGTCRLVLQL